MSINLSQEQRAEIIQSLRRYFTERLSCDLSEMHAGFLLEYFLQEMAPFAYNKGVEDAQKYFMLKAEDLTGECFEEGLTFWKAGKGGSIEVRRKPGG